MKPQSYRLLTGVCDGYRRADGLELDADSFEGDT